MSQSVNQKVVQSNQLTFPIIYAEDHWKVEYKNVKKQ